MLEKLKQLNIVARQNEPLKNHTTFQIGGPAKWYLEAENPHDLIEVLKVLKSASVEYLLLGGGSNLLVSDKGYNGAVIRLKPRELAINGCEVVVDSGYSLAGLIMKTLDASLVGLEFEAGVPGTVGGAIKGNAGTYGEAMDKVVKTVDFVNDDLQLQTFNNADCRYIYRYSIFKDHDSWIIVSSKLELQKGDIASARTLVDQRIEQRKKTQPYGYPSAGCIFKNLIYSQEYVDKFSHLGWEVPEKFKAFGKIPVSWLVEQMDLKGKTIGRAQISEKHANYIINLGGAKAEEVVQLISIIKQQARDKTGIQLQEEVRYLGF